MDNNKINEIVTTYQKNKNIFMLLGMVILVLLLVFIKLSFGNRTQNKIKEYKYHINKSTKNIKKCYAFSDEEPKYSLCDYDICSSYNTGLIGNQTGDYISLDMIKKILLTGARYLEFQIVSNDYSDKPEPYIGIGAETGNWIYSLNVLELNDVLNLINKYAFYSNNNNPLMIYLTFNNYKPYLINKTGDIILEKLKPFLLKPNLYKNKLLITRQLLCNLTKKIIILSNLTELQLKDTSFESVNIPDRGYVKRLYFKDAEKYLYYQKDREFNRNEIQKSFSTFRKKEQERFKKEYESIKDITILNGEDYFKQLLEKNFYNPILHFNKVGITILLPHQSDDIFTKNIESFNLFREHGIQIISMNFQLFNPSPKAPFEDNTTTLDKYLYYFREESFILKEASKFHRINTPDLNKYTEDLDYKKDIPDFEQNIPSDFQNTPIRIELYPNTEKYLSYSNIDTVQFDAQKNLFMIYPSFSKKSYHQNSFVISPLNKIIQFDYKKRMFLYHKSDSQDNYSFKQKPLEKDIKKQDDFNNESSFEVLKTPVCENSPIISKDFKIVTLTESDYKKDIEVKYIGFKNEKLSQYEMNENEKTINNSCFVFTKYYPLDLKKENSYKLFIYFQIPKKKYLSNKLLFTDNKPTDIFEVTNFTNIFNNNMDIMNTSNSFNLKNANKLIKYNEFSVTKSEKHSALFKIITDANGKEKLYLYNELETKFSFELIYENNKFEFIKSGGDTKPNYIECFVKYTIKN